MIPNIDPESIVNSGECDMYRRLRDSLPPSWTVRYHYTLCWFDGPILREHECDFIVLAPGKGLLLLEVKGSHGYDCKDGQWYRVKPDGTREATRNPFDQASAAKHTLVERLAWRIFKKSKFEFPGIYGHLVVYPFGRELGQLPQSTEPVVLLAYADMASLHQSLEQTFSDWGDQARGSKFTPDAMACVEKFLSDETTLVPVDAWSVEQDDRRIKELTNLQFSAFRGILDHHRVHVRGTAGSGKTLIALWAAQAIATGFGLPGDQQPPPSGLSVLLLCYNRNLAAWLNRQFKKPPLGSVHIHSFFSLCRQRVLSTGKAFDVPSVEGDQEDFWTVTAPALFCNALEQQSQLASQYDAILVDEAQDFHQDWWLPVELLLRDTPNQRLVVFSDPEQTGIYGHGKAFPDGLTSYRLLENCRNTKRIARFCGKVIGQPIESFTNSPEGVVPVVHEAHESPAQRGVAVKTLVRSLLSEGMNPSQIAILYPSRQDPASSALSGIATIDAIPLRGDENILPNWLAGTVIWSSTIKSFKGLEADCVIIADAPSPSSTPGFNLSDLYVAASRSKHRLHIFPTSAASKSEADAWVAAASAMV